MNRQLIVKSYGKNILLGLILSTAIGIALYYGIDKKIIVLSAFIIGVFTELFVGVVALIAAIPLIGPMIIKIVSIPIFWVLNALGTLVSGIAIKKGYATELARGRIMTLALLIGMIIGYIIGNLIPL
jgi:phage shock protein PspC (stress-responsive transcriptional regulator)|tara:strand:+ start:173 stop:553 length:381 start_codon:yes stop_codon:yes gene_type:complete